MRIIGESRINEAVDIEKIIKDLQGNFDGSNENQMQGVQLLKGLATSDDPKANEFMKKLNKATTDISKEILGKEEQILVMYSNRIQERMVGDPTATAMALPSGIKNRAKNAVQTILSQTYFPSVPMGPIMDALEDLGIYVVDESGEVWEGFLTGREGRETFELMYEGHPVRNAVLVLSWYKMPSGKYEVTGYIS